MYHIVPCCFHIYYVIKLLEKLTENKGSAISKTSWHIYTLCDAADVKCINLPSKKDYAVMVQKLYMLKTLK